MTDKSKNKPPIPTAAIGLWITLFGALTWSYWPTIEEIADRWATDPQYSHGYLVPLIALAILWFRRGMLEKLTFRPNLLWGFMILSMGVCMRLVLGKAFFYYEWFDSFSLMPTVAGLVVLLGGWKGLKWSWPAVIFLFFMLPLPFRLESALRYPLLRSATIASTYLLQTVGLSASADGNIITMDSVRLNVIEACSGLSMLMIFFALSTAVVFIVDRPMLDKVIILLSAAPIAVISNVLRITVTGILHETVGEEFANVVFHDLAGWLMMPVALGLMALELFLLSKLLVAGGPQKQVPMRMGLKPGRAGFRT